MKILVISDSHGRRSTLEDVAVICDGANAPDMVVHLGDNIADARYLRQRISKFQCTVDCPRPSVAVDDSLLPLLEWILPVDMLKKVQE